MHLNRNLNILRLFRNDQGILAKFSHVRFGQRHDIRPLSSTSSLSRIFKDFVVTWMLVYAIGRTDSVRNVI